jgi:hypothetical protein
MDATIVFVCQKISFNKSLITAARFLGVTLPLVGYARLAAALAHESETSLGTMARVRRAMSRQRSHWLGRLRAARNQNAFAFCLHPFPIVTPVRAGDDGASV